MEANATTSWVTNINTYQNAAPGTRAWNLYTFGNDWNTGWKSPWVASAPNDVTQVPGYPTYSSTDGGGLFYEWEWSMVYEWSVDLGPAGANCGNNLVVFITGNSHHSPGKHGSQDDPFDPPTGDQTFSDFGDLPDTYGTTESAGGARHYIKVDAPYLGLSEAAEATRLPVVAFSSRDVEHLQRRLQEHLGPGQRPLVDLVAALLVVDRLLAVLGRALPLLGVGPIAAVDSIDEAPAGGNPQAEEPRLAA